MDTNINSMNTGNTTTAQQASMTDGGSGAQGAASAEPEKKYTQAELDAAIGQRLARERRGMPSQEELTAFRTWKESQQTEQDKQRRILEERNGFEQRTNELETELEQLRRERMLIQRGVSPDDVDYYAYKIGKMVNDTTSFEKAADAFLRQREEKNGAGTPQGVRASFGVPMSKGAQTETLNERINRQLRGG